MGNCCGQSSITECHQQQIVTKDLLDEEYANKAALTIQSFVRGYLIRKKHRNHKHNSVAITGTNEYSYSNKQSRQEIQLVDLKGLNSISKETNIPQNLKTIEKVPETLDDLTKSLRQGLPEFIYEESQLEPGLITRGPVQDELDHIYIGQWKDNAKWGRGIQYWSDGSYYEGYWRDNKQNGKGRLIHVEGDVYEGDWLDDKAHGQGKLTTSNGGYYVGGWINDKQNGQGKELWPDGASFEGHYVDGMKFGQGVYTVANGSQYVGEFADNCFCGFGTYKCSDGTKYIGYWKQNKMNGQGEFHWNDGSKYIGEFLNDLRDGFGTFYYGDGRVYVVKYSQITYVPEQILKIQENFMFMLQHFRFIKGNGKLEKDMVMEPILGETMWKNKANGRMEPLWFGKNNLQTPLLVTMLYFIELIFINFLQYYNQILDLINVFLNQNF